MAVVLVVGITLFLITQKSKTYTSVDGSFKFNHVAKLDVKPTTVINVEYYQDNAVRVGEQKIPAGSVEIPGVITISKIPLSEISEENKFINYTSCCSGTHHWYDAKNKIWRKEDFRQKPDISILKAGESQYETYAVSLLDKGVCSIAEKFTDRTYYKLVGSDEMVQTLYYYILILDDNHAIQGITTFDINAIDYSSYGTDGQPKTPDAPKKAKQILSSLVLDGSSEIKVSCQ